MKPARRDLDNIGMLVEHLLETQGRDAAAVAEGIAASAEASGNVRQQELWLRVRDEIGKRS